jgi:hypothetical protein
VANRCKVCAHKKLNQINRDLVMKWRTKDGFRKIAKRYGLHPSSVYRHFCEHLPEELWAAERARRELNADNLIANLQKHWQRMEKLSDACERVLEDPENPDRWVVGAPPRLFAECRASQIMVHYDVIVDGKAIKRKANLDVLLDALEKGGPKENPLLVTATWYRGEDILKTAREAAKEARGFLELYAKLSGQMQPELDLHLIVDLVVHALRPHPSALRKVLEGLRQLQVPLDSFGKN